VIIDWVNYLLLLNLREFSCIGEHEAKKLLFVKVYCDCFYIIILLLCLLVDCTFVTSPQQQQLSQTFSSLFVVHCCLSNDAQNIRELHAKKQQQQQQQVSQTDDVCEQKRIHS